MNTMGSAINATPKFVLFVAGIILAAAISTACSLLPLSIFGLLLVFTLGLWGYSTTSRASVRAGLWGGLLVVGLVIGLYRPAGFDYPLLVSVDALYEGGEPFALYLNLGKAFAGYCVIAWLFSAVSVLPPVVRWSWGKSLFGVMVVALLIVLIAKLVLGLELVVKPWRLVLFFGVVNLFVTCIAEEAFMRLLVQRQLANWLPEQLGRWGRECVPLVMTTLLFLVTHKLPTLEASFIFGMAGLLYGLVYTMTKSVIWPIVLHFLVNITHFVFLTYPL